MTMTNDDPTRPFEESDVTVVNDLDELVHDLGTETVSVDEAERKVTWGYTRKKNLGNDAFGNPRYESEEVSLYVTDAIPTNIYVMEWVDTHAEPAFDLLKRLVWEALDLSYSFDPDTHRPSVDGDQPQPLASAPPAQGIYPNPRAPQHVAAGQGPQPVPSGPAHTGPPAQPRAVARPDGPTMAQVGHYADPPDFCKKCGQREFWDNRADVDERLKAGKTCTPDFVCKNQDCKNGVFRSGSFEYNQAIKQKPNATGPMPMTPSPVPPDEEPW